MEAISLSMLAFMTEWKVSASSWVAKLRPYVYLLSAQLWKVSESFWYLSSGKMGELMTTLLLVSPMPTTRKELASVFS